MKKEIKKLDLLWAQAVKIKGKCELCGRRDYLNAHHIFSRSAKSVRWDLDNGVCLCAGHHTLTNTSAHKAPIWFIEEMKKRRGEKWYKDLQTRWAICGKPDYSAIEIYLKNFLKTSSASAVREIKEM